jgi:amino acid adenylation domain-containing protein
LGAHYQTFLARAVRQPQIPLSQLSLLTEDEQRQILIDWNDTTVTYPQITIPQAFESRAKLTPTETALIFAGKPLTFTELNRRANQVAHYLKKQGIRRGNFVAICMERSAEMVVALLGVLKAGAAYLPLDPTYPPERLQFMLSETQPALLISQSILASSFTDYTQSTLCLDLAQADLAQEDQTNLQIDIKADDIVYVMYTSGSTGRPKGVLGLHRGAINRFHWMWQRYPFTDDEVCCQKTSLSFVDSVWEIFGPLLQGRPIVIIPDKVLKDTKRFIQTLAAYQVSRIVLVPSLLRVMLNLFPDLQQQLPSLRFWCTSGETLPVELARQFAKAMPASTLVNLYGSSEVSADATCHQIRPDQPLASVSIGRPIANTQVYLLDQYLQPVPVGVPGELYISGDGLARGYLNRPELTEKAFISNPFNDQPHSRLYKTGDLGRWLADGNIEFLGRIDHQVKIRGFRIELGEVETVLSQHPDVCETVVTAREDLPDEKRLVAYFVPSQKQAPAFDDLRLYLKQKLPDYMVPSAFVPVDALPLLPSGKVDRRALPAPDEVWQEPSDSSVKPRDELELQLTKIWEKGLGIKNVGIKDNFFDLGGHSLLAVRLFAQIQKIFGKELPLTTLFQAPTVEQLAGVIRQEGWSSPWSSLVPIQHSGSKPPFFCVHGCGGIVFHMQGFARHLFPDQPLYGLKAQGLEKGQTPHSRIEDMATFYIKEIQTVQPDGPYHLGSTGHGGAVVLEIAQQLKSQGQNVVFLALINAVPLQPYLSNASFIRGIYGGSFKYFINRLVDFMRNRPLLPYVKYTIFNRVLVDWNISRRFVPMDIQREYRFRKAFTNALLNYTAHGYPGRITCIICEKFSGNPQSRVRDWYDIAGGELDVRFVPGTIEEIWRGREPYARILAEQLKACLDEAQVDG